MFRNQWVALIFFLILCFSVELLGRLITSSSVSTWYPMLDKPSWTPPAWTFGPVWTILYIMLAVSIWLVWKDQMKQGSFSRRPFILFGTMLFLSLLWSFFFFYLKNPFLGFFDIAILWLVINFSIVTYWNYSRTASLLLIPFLIWITYAASLNVGIWMMQSLLKTSAGP